MAELSNQEKTSPKFLSDDVTCKSTPIPWLIFIIDELLPVICSICLGDMVKLLKLSKERGLLLEKKKNNPLRAKFN